jgi:hypothetical protein
VYRECFVNTDQALLILVVVLTIFVLGALAAAERNAASARRFRKLYHDEHVAHRRTKFDRSWAAGIPQFHDDVA